MRRTTTAHAPKPTEATFVPWSRLSRLCARVKQRIGEEHAAAMLPGKPLVSVRVTQLYKEGACVYFYFAMGIQGLTAPMETYARIERAAREEVVACGGSVSHHHGVGQVRAAALAEVTSPQLMATLRGVKRAVDPANSFGVGNGVMAGGGGGGSARARGEWEDGNGIGARAWASAN